MLRPLVRRTWAPRGHRPVLYAWDRRERLSVIAALSLSPRHQRLGLYFEMYRHNVKTPEVEAFLRAVRRRLGRPLVVVLDRLPAHQSAAGRLAGDPRFGFEWLPSYAPDLNPMEFGWSHAKYGDLANYAPDNLLQLEIEAILSLEAIHGDQTLMRSFFKGARLNL